MKANHRSLLSVLVAVVLVTMFISYAKAEVLKVGVLCPLTGSFQQRGQQVRDSAISAQKEINAQGGILGRKIELIIEDSENDPRTAALAVTRLLTGEKIVLLIADNPKYLPKNIYDDVSNSDILLLSPDQQTNDMTTWAHSTIGKWAEAAKETNSFEKQKLLSFLQSHKSEPVISVPDHKGQEIASSGSSLLEQNPSQRKQIELGPLESISSMDLKEIIDSYNNKEKWSPNFFRNRRYCPNCTEFEGPGMQNTSFVLSYPQLIERKSSQNHLATSSVAYNQDGLVITEHMLNLGGNVLFRKSRPDKYSDNILGNGVLLNDRCILTAKHVAQAVENNPSDVTILLVGPNYQNLFSNLKYQNTRYINSGEDPDLGLIFIERISLSYEPCFPKLATEKVAVKHRIFSTGCAEFGDLPRLCTGIVTAEAKQRALDSTSKIILTSFGTNLRLFPSLSGSPVYSQETGQLVGILMGGHKLYSKAGSTLISVMNESMWENFDKWTWVVPIDHYRDNILYHLSN